MVITLQLDSQALREYTMTANQSHAASSPYLYGQLSADIVPVPPKNVRSGRRRIQPTDRLGRPIHGTKVKRMNLVLTPLY